MYSVIFGEKYYMSMNDFLESYKNIFKNLYSDTGIEDEYFLHQGYIDNAKKIKNEVKIKVESSLVSEIVAHKFLNNKKSIKIFLKSFMLEIFYEEDNEEKIRFVEDIKINKR